LYLSSAPLRARCTSRSPAEVCCQPSKRTTRTISSMSSTTRSTTIGVSVFLTDSNSSLRAALPRSTSSSGSSSCSAWTTSLASSSRCLRNSMLVSCPRR